MNEQLLQLENHLKELRPAYYSRLNPALNDDEIDSLEEQFTTRLPVDLRQLYKWKNGQADDCYEAFINNSMFVPLYQALDTAAQLTSMIGFDFEITNWWNEQWIPVFHNGGGDYICYDCGGLFTGQKGQLIEFWHADNDRNVIAPSLDVMIQTVNNYYDTTDAADFDEFYSINKKIEGYPKRFKLS